MHFENENSRDLAGLLVQVSVMASYGIISISKKLIHHCSSRLSMCMCERVGGCMCKWLSVCVSGSILYVWVVGGCILYVCMGGCMCGYVGDGGVRA